MQNDGVGIFEADTLIWQQIITFFISSTNVVSLDQWFLTGVPRHTRVP